MTRHPNLFIAAVALALIAGCAMAQMPRPYQKPTTVLAPCDLVLVQPQNGSGETTHCANEFAPLIVSVPAVPYNLVGQGASTGVNELVNITGAPGRNYAFAAQMTGPASGAAGDKVAGYFATQQGADGSSGWPINTVCLIPAGISLSAGCGNEFDVANNSTNTFNPAVFVSNHIISSGLYSGGTALQIDASFSYSSFITGLDISGYAISNTGNFIILQRPTDVSPACNFLNALNAASTAFLTVLDCSGDLNTVSLGAISIQPGNLNTAGADYTINGAMGTGSGAGGGLIFRVAPAGSSGTAQNTLTPAMTIDSATFVHLNSLAGTGARCVDANSGGVLLPLTGDCGVVTGTPASGNLAKFSGAGSLTNGDLSGDCITTGTLATTCAKTGGVAFGGAATLNVGTTGGTVAAGNDSRFSGPTPVTFAGLPGSPAAGTRAIITDATACTFQTAVTVGGGAIYCPVYRNASAWIAG